MTETLTDAVPVTADQIIEITREVWSSFLGLDLDQVDVETTPLQGRRTTGLVHVSGAWAGAVVLECEQAHAVGAAEAMFASDPGGLSEDEISDAFGELTNMVGGNIKSLVPAPSALSIPSVAEGESFSVRVPGGRLVEHVGLSCPLGVLHVSLWEV